MWLEVCYKKIYLESKLLYTIFKVQISLEPMTYWDLSRGHCSQNLQSTCRCGLTCAQLLKFSLIHSRDFSYLPILL